MMRLALSVKYADGSGADVVATAPDLIAFERKFDKAMAAIGSDPRIEYIMWLTWQALQRRKRVTADFDTWSDTVDEVTVGEPDEIVPLEISQPIG